MNRSFSTAMGSFGAAMALVVVFSLVGPAPALALNDNCNGTFFAAITLPPNATIDSVTPFLAAPPLPAYCDVKGHYTDSIMVGGGHRQTG